MNNPAANAGELLHEAEKKREIKRLTNLGTNPLFMRDDWTQLELTWKLLDKVITPEDVLEYCLAHEQEIKYPPLTVALNKYYDETTTIHLGVPRPASLAIKDEENKKNNPVLVSKDKNNSPDYNVSIYISMLWDVKKREIGGGDNSDKLSKTGDTMLGELKMSGNRITGLSHEYPPDDLNDAASWGQVGLKLFDYVAKTGSMMTGPLGVQERVIINKSGISLSSHSTFPSGDGLLLQIRQRGDTRPERITDGIQIVEGSDSKRFHLGISSDNNLTMYSANEAGSVAQEVCKFSDRTITVINNPINETDVTNKGYVDERIQNIPRSKPIITIWAASRGPLVSGRREWSFGAGGGDNIVNGYVMLSGGRVIRTGLQLINNSEHIVTPSVPICALHVNNVLTETISTGVYIFGNSVTLNQGDVLSFTTLITKTNVKAVTVSLLIELDL